MWHVGNLPPRGGRCACASAGKRGDLLFVATRFHLVACGKLETCHHGGRCPCIGWEAWRPSFRGDKISSCRMRQVGNLPPRGAGACASAGNRGDLLFVATRFHLVACGKLETCHHGGRCPCIGWEAWRPSFRGDKISSCRMRQVGNLPPRWGRTATTRQAWGPRIQASRPFWTCMRLAASATTTLCGPSITPSVTSSPRRAGRQCMKTASGQCFISASLTW